MLGKTQQMEQFNIAYVLAIAARAGYNHTQPAVDDHSVDISISAEFPVKEGIRCDPEIKLQLKSVTDLKIKNGTITYFLKKKNYDDLTKPCCGNPRYLIVCDLPDEPNDWLKHEQEFMALRRHCYWVSVANQKEEKDSDNKSGVTIYIPEIQKFTVDTLIKMIEHARTGDRL